MKFTDAKIRGMDAKKTRKVVFEGTTGLGLRVAPTGRKTFVYMYRIKGRQTMLTLGKYPQISLAKARSMMAQGREKISKGIDPARVIKEQKIATKTAPTVEDLVVEYIKRYAQVRKKSWREDERCLNREVVSVWGNRKGYDITRRDIVELLDKIVDRGSPVTANRTLAVVRTMFNFAIKRGILDKSPCVLIEKPSAEKPRNRVLDKNEVRVFWERLEKANMAGQIKLALKLLLITGQRRGEIVNSEWCEVDLVGKWWTIPGEKSKNGRANRVPLSKQALKVLKEIKALSGESLYLFPATTGDQPITERAVSRAVRNNEDFFKLKHFTPHDLRRTVATQMPELKIPQFIVSRILNHAKAGVTDKHYDHYEYDDEKRQALTRWGKRVEEICG